MKLNNNFNHNSTDSEKQGSNQFLTTTKRVSKAVLSVFKQSGTVSRECVKYLRRKKLSILLYTVGGLSIGGAAYYAAFPKKSISNKENGSLVGILKGGGFNKKTMNDGLWYQG